MKQNKMKKHAQTQKKDACPKTASKQNQATGKELFGGPDEKTSGTKTHLYTRADYDASPYLDSVITSFDTKRNVLAAQAINEMHEHFVNIILGHLRNEGIPFTALDGETFTLTLRFTENLPEEP